MASYTISYRCGHGSTEKQLSGPHKERERYIEWAEQTWYCPACRATEEDKQPIVMSVGCNGLDEDRDGNLMAEISITGGTRPRKDEIKALGFSFDEPRASLMGNMLSVSAPKKCWIRRVRLDSIIEAGGVEQKRVQAEAATLGAKLEIGIGPVEVGMIRLRREKASAAADAKAAAVARLAEIKAADPRPGQSPLRARIAEVEKSSGQKWNGKIYGKAGRYNFYVADENYDASDAEVAEREAIIAATAAWDAKYAAEIAAAK